MAAPLTPDQIVRALKAEGVSLTEYKQWRIHNRNHKGAWGPVNGIMIHHTASSGELSSVDLCYDGYESLPGPLCQAVIGKSGQVYLTGNGRCNHAGMGSPDVMAAVMDERYNDRPPATRHHEGSAGAVDGNARFYGAECVNLGNGKDPWPDKQIDALVRWATALCRAHGWTAKSVIGHKEWTDWKPDPHGPGDVVSMPRLRAKIAERLAHPPGWNPAAATTPAPAPQTGTPMTKPNRSHLKRFDDMTVAENTPAAIYWTHEYPDDANGHGDGGKTVGSNITYDAVVNLTITGLGEDQHIEVYAAEEDPNGVLLGESAMRAQVWGKREGYHPVKASVPVSGYVGNRLSFRITSRASSPVTVEEAELYMHSWPLS
jgi:N-acetylmuramoyl-L-alanine amidase